jgi:hypothetical protein
MVTVNVSRILQLTYLSHVIAAVRKQSKCCHSVWQDSKRVSLQCDKSSHSLSGLRRKEAACRRCNHGARMQLKFGIAHFKMCFTTSLCVVRILKSVKLDAFFQSLFFTTGIFNARYSKICVSHTARKFINRKYILNS